MAFWGVPIGSRTGGAPLLDLCNAFDILDLEMTAQAAVDAPRLHLDRETVHLEAGIAPAVATHLETHGQRVRVWPVTDLYFGGAQVAGRRREAGETSFDGGGDPRRGGAALIV